MTFYYRLTNSYNGPMWSLDVSPSADTDPPRYDLSIARTGDHSGQFWKLVPTTTNAHKFHLRTIYKGDEYSLDIINDGVNETPCLAKSGNYSGQYWTLTRVGEDTWKLSNDFTGNERFLDVFSDRMQPRMQPGNTTGMFWTLTLVRMV